MFFSQQVYFGSFLKYFLNTLKTVSCIIYDICYVVIGYPYVWTDCNGRRESQGSLSSGTSQDLNTTCSGGKNEVRGL